MAEGPVLALPGIELHTLHAEVVRSEHAVSDGHGGWIQTVGSLRLHGRLAAGEATRSFAWLFDHLGTAVEFTLTSPSATVTGEVLIEDSPVEDGWINWHVNRLDE